MPRRFQFSLRALLVATAFIATGTLLARLVIDDPSGLGNAPVFAQGSISCFGAAIGSFTKRPQIWIPVGLLSGPALFILALIYMAGGIILGY